MAVADAHPIPLKNAAYRVTFPIRDAQGNLVAGATGLDSERSLDGAAFVDCSNEATHIAQGVYYLDLTAAEMNADTTVVIVKSTEGEPTVIVLHPEEAGDIRVNVTQVNGVTEAAADLGRAAATTLPGTVDTAGFTPTQTEFEASDITEATSDHYKGRIVIFTSGALKDQASDVTAYSLVTGRGHFTVSALTEAPANTDTFVIV